MGCGGSGSAPCSTSCSLSAMLCDGDSLSHTVGGTYENQGTPPIDRGTVKKSESFARHPSFCASNYTNTGTVYRSTVYVVLIFQVCCAFHV